MVGDSDPMDFGKMISTSSLTLSTKVTGFGYGKQWLRCFKDKDTEKCQTYNSYWKMNSRIASEFGHFTIQLDGFVFINVREKVCYNISKSTWYILPLTALLYAIS